MDNLYDLSDRDICQPKWLTEFMQCNFADYFHYYDHEHDFDDFIHPIESDGVTEYFFQSHLYEILKLQTSQKIQLVENYLRSIDQLQKEYLPSKHLESLRFLVSISLILTCFVDVSFDHLISPDKNFQPWLVISKCVGWGGLVPEQFQLFLTWSDFLIQNYKFGLSPDASIGLIVYGIRTPLCWVITLIFVFTGIWDWPQMVRSKNVLDFVKNLEFRFFSF